MILSLLNVKLNLSNYSEAFSFALTCINEKRSGYFVFSNPHSVMLCRRNPEMMKSTSSALLVLPDGIGIILIAKVFGYKCNRVTGPSFMLYACDNGRNNKIRHYFYGGTNEILKKLRQKLLDRYPGIIISGMHSPPFQEQDHIAIDKEIENINNSYSDIIWVGLGAPKQEIWMNKYASRIRPGVMMGVGAAFDFHSGGKLWAPFIFRYLGIEWIWRLAFNPIRMWPRSVDGIKFIFLSFYEMTFKKHEK